MYYSYDKSSRGKYFAGEWSAKWDVKEATMQDYQRFARAMLDVYGRATFGWSYWTYKIRISTGSLSG